ncbi:MAG: hypothetical protein Q4D96_11035 [Propionibacteriaceae bacterium]|nr:hypothetical protein [Propionibacteriaceae bacterium]
MTALEQRIIDADHLGDLDEAIRLASRQLLLPTVGTPIEQRITCFIRLSRVLRHRSLGDDLQRALDAASQATYLASLPTAPADLAPLARLAQASAALALGDEQTCREIAEPLTHPGDDPDPTVAVWAWQLLGEAALRRGEMSEAIACLLDALAEERPHHGHHGFDATRILLLDAFSRAGHILDADQLAREVVASDLPPRRRAALLLVRAGHEHRFGRIDQALDTLAEAEELLRQGSGLNRMLVRLHQLRAACLDDWQLTFQARQERHLAQALTTWPSPSHPGTTPLTRTTPDGPSVAELIAEFQRLPTLPPRHAQLLQEAARRLHGIPGKERTEALELVAAGTVLAHGQAEVHATAARLLRRALARLTYLEGTELWQARCRCELGLLLTDSQPVQALELLVAAANGLSEQRHLMRHRSHRSTWRKRVENPPFAATIELAHRLGRDDLAADLIIASRLAGVVTPDGRGDHSPGNHVVQVPLRRLPQLIHIDGARSQLGGTEVCRLL